MAECHPVGFQWVMEAKARGATVIHVDPRFTRTSALADLHVPLRAGSDIVFLGGIINYVLASEKYFRDYVVNYTNAATLLTEDFADTEDLDGVFSGLDREHRTYDFETWRYQGAEVSAAAGDRDRPGDPEEPGDPEANHGPGHRQVRQAARGEAHGSGGAAAHRDPDRDETLQHPRCVFQVLKRHFARYTPEMVEQACGVPPEAFARVCELVTENSGPERTTAFVYSVGWTQHTVGAQYIRTAAILQLLLGNIGRPGGGILALRGHASIQGSTDIPTLFDLLPGYLPMPHVHGNEDLATYVDAESTDKGFWADMGSYMVSLLKAWWGEAATADNDFCYDYLPRLTGSHSTYETVAAQIAGDCPGYFLFGENPAVGSANGRMQRFGLANLDWLVVRDLVLIESATFWQNGPEIETGEMRTEDIGTEVFFLPAAAHTEKNGSFTNTQRMLQWHHEAVEPAGDARSDLWFAYHLGRRIREKLAASADEMDRPVQDLTWDYPVEGPLAEPSAEAVLAEVNGWDADGKPLSSYAQLKDDGSTACGCWIYCGVRADGVNQAARRKPGSEQSWVAPEWGWAWPLNRRILYNRASADPDGKPWSERKALVWWDADAGKWTGHDVRRLRRRPAAVLPAARRTPPAWTRSPASTRSSCRPTARAGCSPRPAWWTARCPRTTSRRSPRSPTCCTASSATRSARSSGTRGTRSSRPAANSAQRCSPTSPPPTGSPSTTPPAACRACCPICPSCSRSSSARSRPSWRPSGAWSTRAGPRSSPRAAAVEARVLVTERIRTIEVQGRRLHQIGLPYHWGGNGLTTGDSANDLAHLVLDPNVHIQEVKAMACDIRPGRRPRGPALRRLVREYARRAGITDDTGTEV